MIKRILFVSLTCLLANLAAISSLLAQAQGRTPPAGYIVGNLGPSLDGVNRANTPLSYPLHSSAIFSGAISSVSGNTLTLNGAALSNVTATPYIIHITAAVNPSAVGRSFLVTSSSTTSVTANPSGLQLSSLLTASDQVLIYSANTLGSIFGTTDQTIKLQGAASSNNADLVYIWNGTSWASFYYSPGIGWLLSGDTTQTVQNNYVIFPDRAMLVSRISTNPGSSSLLIMGTVPQNAQAITVNAPGTTLVANPLPTPVTLSQFNIAENGGWKDGATAGDADTLYTFQGTNWQTYYHMLNYGWVLDADPNYMVQDSHTVPAASGFLIYRQSAFSPAVIQVPLTYTVN